MLIFCVLSPIPMVILLFQQLEANVCVDLLCAQSNTNGDSFVSAIGGQCLC